MNLQLVNVLLLGAAFHLIFFSYQTSVFIQQTVVNSIKTKPEYNFTGNGYISLCITYAVFAISNWLAPSIIALTGLKLGMFIGSLTYCLYSASFIYPTTSLFYSSAALIGLGAGPLWSAQGSYLTKNSDTTTSGRNAAIFWSMLQSSILFGNIFVYLAFNNQTVISDETRYVVYGVLTLVCALGALLLLFLRDSDRRTIVINDEEIEQEVEQVTVLSQFLGALKLARSFNMILLSFTFLFTGQLSSFFTGVYGTSIGATSQFGPDSKKFIGLAGIFIGIGEILGGSIFGLLGARVSRKLGRDTIVIIGYLTVLIAFASTYINLPPDSPLVEHAIRVPIIEPRLWIAILSSLLIGFGDACFNTQIYALLMSAYNNNSVAAFALFKFTQALGSAITFLYSTKFDLYYQLIILSIVSTAATLCYCLVEWRFRSFGKSESQQSFVERGQEIQQTTYGSVEDIATDAGIRSPNHNNNNSLTMNGNYPVKIN